MDRARHPGPWEPLYSPRLGVSVPLGYNARMKYLGITTLIEQVVHSALQEVPMSLVTSR